MFLEKDKERFQGTYVTLTEIDESVVTKINAVSVKVDSTSEIVVYGSRDYYGSTVISKIVIKVISIGSYTEILQPLEESNSLLTEFLNELPLVAPALFAVLITLLVNYIFSAQINIFTVYVVSFFNPHAFRTG
ncbi:unnamed protein product [Caenorhabditis nigoni]